MLWGFHSQAFSNQFVFVCSKALYRFSLSPSKSTRWLFKNAICFENWQQNPSVQKITNQTCISFRVAFRVLFYISFLKFDKLEVASTRKVLDKTLEEGGFVTSGYRGTSPREPRGSFIKRNKAGLQVKWWKHFIQWLLTMGERAEPHSDVHWGDLAF